jgi:predicted alpha/beta hydrolase family esterase
MTPTLLIVPGLRDHVPQHWQTLLEQQVPGARSVPPLEHDKLSRAARVAALDAALQAIDGPVILVAHSAGVITTAHWAQQHQRPIHGALLVTPADLENPLPEGYPVLSALEAGGWLPIPRARLPFPSIVAASRNDPLAVLERISGLAADWGSRLEDLGDVGHLNPAAGFGPWPQAQDLIRQLV